MTTATQRLTADEIAERGEAIYDRDIRARAEKDSDGKFVAIDIVTGDFEIDDDDDAASDRLWARHPGNLQYEIRIGYKAAGLIGSTWEAARNR